MRMYNKDIVVPTESITLVPVSLFLGIPTICIPPNGYCLLPVCLLLGQQRTDDKRRVSEC